MGKTLQADSIYNQFDADGDGVCDWPVGCTEASACNYNVDANFNDGSCEWCSCAPITLPDSSDLTGGILRGEKEELQS